MIVYKIARRQMGRIKKGESYFRISGRDLSRLKLCAKIMGTRSLQNANDAICAEFIKSEEARLGLPRAKSALGTRT